MKRIHAPRTRSALLTIAIKNQIEQAKFVTGSILPTEASLCEQFNVSRHTVRAALSELKRLGLIASKQGSGSVVIAESVSTKYINTVNEIDDLTGITEPIKRTLLDSAITPLEANLIKKSQTNPKQLWVRLDILHKQPKNPLPIMYAAAYIDAKYSEIQKYYNGKQKLVGQLQEIYGLNIVKMHQELQAVALNKKESDILDCKPGTPALKATRLYYGQDLSLIYVSVNLSPSDRYIYKNDFKLNE